MKIMLISSKTMGLAEWIIDKMLFRPTIENLRLKPKLGLINAFEIMNVHLAERFQDSKLAKISFGLDISLEVGKSRSRVGMTKWQISTTPSFTHFCKFIFSSLICH